MSYRLLLLTPIPVHGSPGAYETLDLWVRDLAGQVTVVDSLTLIASRRDTTIDNGARLPEGIRVCDADALTPGDLDRLVREPPVDVHLGEPGEETRYETRDVEMSERPRRRDAKLTAGRTLQMPDLVTRGLRFFHDSRTVSVESFSGFGEAHRPCGPAQQLGSEVLLEARELLADGCLRAAESTSRLGETAGFDDARKRHHRRDLLDREVVSHRKRPYSEWRDCQPAA